MASDKVKDLEALAKQLAEVQASYNKALEAQRGVAIEEVKAKVAQFNITAAEIGLAATKQQFKRKSPKAKYQNPHDPSQTWSGRGRSPIWINDLVARGKKLEDLLIK